MPAMYEFHYLLTYPTRVIVSGQHKKAGAWTTTLFHNGTGYASDHSLHLP
jgi:hypothetical protein